MMILMLYMATKPVCKNADGSGAQYSQVRVKNQENSCAPTVFDLKGQSRDHYLDAEIAP